MRQPPPDDIPDLLADSDPEPPRRPEPKPAGFNPFADVEVDVKSALSGTAGAAAPAAPAAPGPERAAPAAPPPAADADDARPGARKDLWKCPHCGAGNKPERERCRVCGRSPAEPVVPPWHRRPLVVGGLAAALLLVAVGLAFALRVDTSLRPATLAAVDAAPRVGGRASASLELPGEARFEGERRFAVCGRVAAVEAGPHGTRLVLLALGAAAREAAPARDGALALACLPSEGFAPRPGQLLSLAGIAGVIVREGRVQPLPEGARALSVEAFAVGDE